MKNNKGITLIALIVTIIVLIILAGVAIAMLRGDNGILNRAEEAKYLNVIGSTDEQVRLAQMALRTTITAEMVNVKDPENGYIATSSTNFTNLVNEVVKDLGVTAKNTATKEGFSVYDNAITNGSASSNGTGYIMITYTDNALRSSLPEDKVATSPFTLNGVKFTKVGSSFSVNNATIVYVIKVSNYTCQLSNAIMTNDASITAAKAATDASAFESSVIGQALEFDGTATTATTTP